MAICRHVRSQCIVGIAVISRRIFCAGFYLQRPDRISTPAMFNVKIICQLIAGYTHVKQPVLVRSLCTIVKPDEEDLASLLEME